MPVKKTVKEPQTETASVVMSFYFLARSGANQLHHWRWRPADSDSSYILS